MTFQVQSIKKDKESNSYQVTILDRLGPLTFQVEVDVFEIAGQKVQNISSEDAFWQYCNYHPMMVTHVHQLVADVYNKKYVAFPVRVTEQRLLTKLAA